VLSRTIFAARISVEVALVAVGVGLIGGTIIGLMAAYSGGFVDLAMMRCMDLLFSFPAILLAVVLMASLGTSILNAMIAIGIIFIPGFARLARASSMSVLRQQYIEAARTIGMGHFRILIREILPNAVTPLLVEAAIAFAYAVLLESALSFLGLGAQGRLVWKPLDVAGGGRGGDRATCGVCTSLIYKWRREERSAEPASGFARVMLADKPCSSSSEPEIAAITVELGGVRVRIGAAASAALVAATLKALRA
jgi:ABC-type proline/glycine betaine transport system permease subunit